VKSKTLCRSIDSHTPESKAASFFEISIFMKKKLAFRHHLVGTARVTTADFLSCLECKELIFPLEKPGRGGHRGEVIASVQFEVSHRNAGTFDAVRPGYFKNTALQIINLVVLHSLRELPKGAE
jgi:hypothetical protein